MSTGDRRLPASVVRPNRFEVANGVVEGFDDTSCPLPTASSESPRAALEQAVATALARGPVTVSFSGGRDSSAVLAVAAHVARREGLAAPVPLTLRFPEHAESDEREWQERVVRHLGLQEWHTVDVVESDLDFVGPVMGDVLRRHGVLWPANLAFHRPLLESSRGGTLLTGVDGDVLFGGWRWQSSQQGAQRFTRSYPVLLAASMSPVSLRRVIARRCMWQPPWLRQEATHLFAAWQAETWSLEPRTWDRRVRWWWRRRYLAALRSGFGALAEDANAAVVHPFLDPTFVATLALAGGADGLGDRTAILHGLLRDLLPEAVLSRRSKAVFNKAMWGQYTRDFVRDWDGCGLDTELLSAEALRREWSKPTPHMGSALALQTAWLATHV